jgi:hypothetical protein
MTRATRAAELQASMLLVTAALALSIFVCRHADKLGYKPFHRQCESCPKRSGGSRCVDDQPIARNVSVTAVFPHAYFMTQVGHV